MQEDYRRQLADLMSRLARLLSPRSATPRKRGYIDAYGEIRRFAERFGHDEQWCDLVMSMMLEEQRIHERSAARAA
jgi:hypothetical protein